MGKGLKGLYNVEKSFEKKEEKKTQTHILEGLAPSVFAHVNMLLLLLLIAHKARTYWYHRPFRLIYQYQIKERRHTQRRTEEIIEEI